MPLALYGHPFSSYTQKVLIALYENGTDFEFRCIGPDTPEHAAEWARRWPVRLLPEDPMAALEVRFLDRCFDLHVMDAAQVAVSAALGRLGQLTVDAGQAISRERLEPAYAWFDARLGDGPWAAGRDFSMADCAAAPSLFYADWVHPIGAQYPALRAYRTRLLARPAFARAVDEARVYRPLFPLGAPDRD